MYNFKSNLSCWVKAEVAKESVAVILGISAHRDGQTKHIRKRLDRLTLTVQYFLEAL